jgi:hypothetical protein
VWGSLQWIILGARFGLATHCERVEGVEKLTVLSQVAVSAKRHEVRERIVPLLAPFDLCGGSADLPAIRTFGTASRPATAPASSNADTSAVRV